MSENLWRVLVVVLVAVILSGCLFAAAILGGIVNVVGGTLKWGATTATNSAKGVIEKTADSDHVLAAYGKFRDLKNDYITAVANYEGSVVSYNAYVESLPKDRKEWSFEDKTEQARQLSVVNGQKQYANDIASKYNAASEKANFAMFKNLPIWQDEPLPETLEVLQ